MLALGLAFVLAQALALAPPADDAAAVVRGRALTDHFQCNRCHSGNGLAEPAPDKACVGCHAQIEAGTFEAPADVLHRWQDHIVDLTMAPSLDGGTRFRRAWLVDFLQRPHAHDLRPNLSAQMPRLAISEADARDLAAWINHEGAASARDPLTFAAPLHGRKLVESKGCASCHQMSGLALPLRVSAVPVPLTPAALQAGITLAPDLRFARDRLVPERLVEWLMKPSAMKPTTPMPDIPLRRDEAEDIAAFLLEKPLAPRAEASVPPRLPILERRVSFKEVSEHVFRKTCWHCHSEPDLALGDGGPGNTGGFGFEGRGLSFVDYTTISGGSLDDQGNRRSIFKPLADGTPRLLAHILARQVEATGHDVPGVRGMPLGLPPLSREDVQLVESWIAQGRPE